MNTLLRRPCTKRPTTTHTLFPVTKHPAHKTLLHSQRMEVSSMENGSSKADDEVKPTRQSLTRAVMFIILFNVVLLCATISGYFYLASMDKSIHARIVDFLIIGGATIAIPLLYGLGDLSKGKPNFYYI